MKIYITVLGDTWDNISFKAYGTETYMHILIAENPEHSNIIIFSAGVEIKLPEIKIQAPNTHPPWRRG